jgi:glutathione-regulated potassium-efflux system ancillary protein KefF
MKNLISITLDAWSWELRQSYNSITSKIIICIWLISLIASSSIFAQSKTLVIASHPYPERSVINKALQQTVKNMDGIIYRNLETLYGNDITAIDVAAERKAYEEVDRVVYMYPIHWFNLTPMLKAYFNEVWFQWAPQALKGKEMLVVVTAGADEQAYSHEGKIGLTIEEVLAPMKACANYVGMTYLKPLAFLGVTGADENKIRTYQKQLAERLNEKD